MYRQIHGQTLQDDATCPAPHMSQLVANHHILTEHGRILSDDHSPEEFLSGWMGQQVQSSLLLFLYGLGKGHQQYNL